MASVDKVRIGTTTYDMSPSKDGTLIGYTSNDAASPTAWTDAAVINTASDTNGSIFSKITTMIKNARWLFSVLGTVDFSSTGATTISDALVAIKTALDGKASSSHSHTTGDLTVSSTQINSESYIPTSSVFYAMQQKLDEISATIDSLR